VDRLADRGLAERRRDPQDARHTLVRLTPRGREVVARVAAGRLARLARVAPDPAAARELAARLRDFLERSLEDPRDLAEATLGRGL
jgi:DNA-binding MarR family transcriptional regulator